jgi:PHP family Zn ribbon phosphoesterase
MKLKDAFLCIDCDEVFTTEGSRCNPRCPTCASSVLMPVSAFLQTLAAPERGKDETARPRLEIVHTTPIAA